MSKLYKILLLTGLLVLNQNSYCEAAEKSFEDEQAEFLTSEFINLDITGHPVDASGNRKLQTIDQLLQFFPLPQRLGFSDECSNLACEWLEYALSCKALGFGMRKICTQYYLGYTYSCPTFYPPDQVYDAPSVCLQEWVGFVRTATGISDPDGTFQQTYLGNPNWTTNSCGRNCYQEYQERSNKFYLTCAQEIATYPNATTEIPLLTLLNTYQEFRNQACGKNDFGDNCYVSINSVVSSSSTSTSTVNPLNFECNYAGLTDTWNQQLYSSNAQVFQQFCANFGSLGCCAASGINLVQQNQLNFTNPIIFPPCLLQYLNDGCSSVDLLDFCNNGSIANQTTLTGTFTIPKVTTGQLPFPDVYDKTSVQQLQGVITNAFASLGFGVQPYKFIPNYPYQVLIIGYDYLNASGNSLTPTNGSVYYPPQGDYNNATSGVFTYQLVVQNLNESLASDLAAAQLNPQLAGAVSGAYTGGQALVTATSLAGPITEKAIPLDVSSASNLMVYGRVLMVLATAFGVLLQFLY